MAKLFWRATTVAVVAALSVSGCASTPRGFAPVLTTSPADQAAYEAAFAVCSEQVASGRRESFREGRGGSAMGGAAIGGGAAIATAATAASGAGMLGGVAAGAGLLAGAVVFVPLALWGVSRVQRANKEREIQTAMSTCLAEEGYAVQDWRLAHDGDGQTSPVRATPED